MVRQSHQTTRAGRTQWVLDRDEPTEIIIDGVGTEAGHRTNGETYSYLVVFRDRDSRPVDSALVRYNNLLDRARHAGDFELHDLLEGRTEFTPTWPPDSESLVVHLTPSNHRPSPIPGLWGLLDAVEIDTPPSTDAHSPPHSVALSLDIVHLADSDEFDDREALENDLQHSGLF